MKLRELPRPVQLVVWAVFWLIVAGLVSGVYMAIVAAISG